MKYRDLIQFDPIETVVQLRDADHLSRAEHLVSSYVISDEMAERLELMMSHLQFDHSSDNRALLIVGNYGTGKSHLMSVVSAVAEHAELLDRIGHPRVRVSATQIAGKFKVVRTEIGSTLMSLREIVTAVLEEHLESEGVAYRFPAATQIVNNKAAFEEMMAAFEVKFPDQGVLLVVDELLDFLRTRKDHDLIQDLQFLREIGEVCKDLRFRFIGGLQETLFDSPRFSFVADTVRRVKDRFEQVLIARKDVKFVVAQRLLKKTAAQQVSIGNHFAGFAKYYEGMTERMDEFVAMFPIHPDYVDVFERLVVVERREVLRTLSRAMERLLDRDVPTDDPGVVAFDSYWDTLSQNPAYRTIPEVREVIECSSKLQSLIDMQYPRDKKLARRIINGLSVHRLSTGDIETQIGLSAVNLRDMLCLFDPLVADLGGEPADDLRGEVEVALQAITRSVNGQFISATERDARGNPSGQFYLDVKKVVDYDAQVDRRAESLGDDELDRYYFEALKRVMECTDQTYVTGYRIWEHELEWQEKRTTRSGYLFFGTPNDRSTAAPPRDFYIYFLPPKSRARFKDDKQPDDVFFRLERPDAAFDTALAKYAAATVLYQSSSGQAKSVYESKSYDHLRALVRWLQNSITTAYDVTNQGKTRQMLEWLRGASGTGSTRAANVRDLVNSVASVCLTPHFDHQAPDYPRFSTLITGSSRAQAAQDALRVLRGISKTQQGTAVLDALGLLEGERVHVAQSRYAAYITEALRNKPSGQVLNRPEVIRNVQGVEYMNRYRLEPEWVAVLLGALVYNGDAVLVLPGERYDAASFDRLVMKPVEELVNFKHIERPKEWNVAALRELFELMGLTPGDAQAVSQGQDNPVKALQAGVEQLVGRVLNAQQRLQTDTSFWGKPVLADQELAAYTQRLGAAKSFLESLQGFTTAGKLKNLTYDAAAIQAQKPSLAALSEVESLTSLLAELRQLTAYLSQAELALPPDYPWLERAKELRDELAAQLSSPTRRSTATFRQQASQRLTTLKQDYINSYMALHTRARLTVSDDRRKDSLLRDPRLDKLKRLARINALWQGQSLSHQTRLGRLRSCFSLTAQDLQTVPICPHCGFNPAREGDAQPAADTLKALDAEQDQLLAAWVVTLLEELQVPVTQTSIAVLQEIDRQRIAAFVNSGKLPDPLTDEFVDTLRQAFSGLQQVAVPMEALRTKLAEGGLPATPDELKRRFERYMDSLSNNTDPNKVRIALE